MRIEVEDTNPYVPVTLTMDSVDELRWMVAVMDQAMQKTQTSEPMHWFFKSVLAGLSEQLVKYP